MPKGSYIKTPPHGEAFIPGLAEGDTSKDEEIARKLQAAEQIPYEQTYSEVAQPSASAFSKLGDTLRYKFEEYEKHLPSLLADQRDYERQQAKMARDAIKREKEALEKERQQRLSAEKRLKLMEEKPHVTVRKLYGLDYPYTKWYDYIPNWYSPLERRRLQLLIDKLLDRVVNSCQNLVKRM